jgi:hypothetical protein
MFGSGVHPYPDGDLPAPRLGNRPVLDNQRLSELPYDWTAALISPPDDS